MNIHEEAPPSGTAYISTVTTAKTSRVLHIINTCCLHIRPFLMPHIYSASWGKPFVGDLSEMSQQISTRIATKTVLQS